MEKITIKAINTTYQGSEDWEFIGRVTAYSISPNNMKINSVCELSIYVKCFESIGPRFIAERSDQWHTKYMVNRLSDPIYRDLLALNAKIGNELYIYIDAFDE